MRESPLILVIDDDELDLGAMEVTLKAAGFQVETCESGKDALRRARELQPDLVITDLMMAPPDGFEICRGLDEDELLRSVPRIVVSAIGEKMHKSTTGIDVQSRVDADDFMEKPVDPKELGRRVRELLVSGRAARGRTQGE